MHRHAKLMEQYAKDAMRSDAPWTLWQFQRKGSESWLQCRENPSWRTDMEFRRLNLGDPRRNGPKSEFDWS